MWFNGWDNLLQVIVSGFCSYTALIVFLRVSGKRTLSKMNAFDFVVTIAFGSILATALLSKQVAIVEVLAAMFLLVFFQYVITFLSVRSKRFSHLIKSEPKLLFHRGEYLQGAMKKERINKDELLQAMRGNGILAPEQVEAVVLETDGSLSVIAQEPDTPSKATITHLKGS